MWSPEKRWYLGSTTGGRGGVTWGRSDHFERKPVWKDSERIEWRFWTFWTILMWGSLNPLPISSNLHCSLCAVQRWKMLEVRLDQSWSASTTAKLPSSAILILWPLRQASQKVADRSAPPQHSDTLNHQKHSHPQALTLTNRIQLNSASCKYCKSYTSKIAIVG